MGPAQRALDDTASALCDFLLQIRSDADAGTVRSLPDYLGRFPGFEAEVAREYLAFVGATRALPAESEFPADADDILLARLSVPRRSIERYDLGAEIGRGGMATVRSVRDLELDRELAMKVIARGGGVARRRFLAEARVTGRLDHPGIVPVHELGLNDEGELFFTMRRVEGIDFEHAIARVHAGDPDWTLSRALEVLIKVCDTIAFAHARGIVHRDLKPSNVMTGRFGEVYVVDWGLARVPSSKSHAAPLVPGPSGDSSRADPVDETPWLTRDGDVTGTPAYMSPEQAAGRTGEVGPRSDVYAGGAILYQLLTNRRPYSEPGKNRTTRELLARVASGPPEPLRALRRDAPAELVAICEKAMRRAPDRRYAAMDEMARDLRSFLERRVVAAHASGLRARARKWVARNRALSLVCLVALAGGLLALALVLFERSQARSRLVYLSGARLASVFEELWPPREESLPVLQRWLSDVREFVATREQNVARIADLERRALPMNPSRPAERQARAEMDDLLRRRVAWLAELRAMERDLDTGQNPRDGHDRAWIDGEIEFHERRVREDRDRPTSQRTFEFDDPDDQRLYDGLVRVVRDQAAFTDAESSLSLIHLAEWGLSASQRVARETVEEARSRWDEAIASIADEGECPAYHGLHLAPQMGLVPFGRDPTSGLWEFVHVLSGEIPARGSDGRLDRREDDAIVLVLIPGGRWLRGSQRDDFEAANYDPWAEPNAPAGDHAELEPFFLAKYEMTQAQWLRIAGSNPSRFAPSNDPGGPSPHADVRFGVSGSHPVEQVSFLEASLVTRVLGLTLPTEAQWEWSARASSTTPWWGGAEPCEAYGKENFADPSAASWGIAPIAGTADPLEPDDGWPVHAPVGSFPPNPYGLHDMLGNVREWCRDGGNFSYTWQIRVFTGERAGREDGTRAIRGGSFELDPIHGRIATRQATGPVLRLEDLGLRVAREIER